MTQEEKEKTVYHLRNAENHLGKARDILSKNASIELSSAVSLLRGRVSEIIGDAESDIILTEDFNKPKWRPEDEQTVQR